MALAAVIPPAVVPVGLLRVPPPDLGPEGPPGLGHLRAVRQGNLLAFEDPRLSRLGPSVVAATENLCAVIDAARQRNAEATASQPGR